MLNTENIQSLIDSGEGYNVEFKGKQSKNGY